MAEEMEPEERAPEERAPEERAEEERSGSPLSALINAGFFLLTLASTFWVGRGWVAPLYPDNEPPLLAGWIFAVPLLAILLAHEFGHYTAARLHRVDASLPFFIPFPIVFGTLGAIIRMRGRIEKRNALLDIGASGPIAGMVVALPVLIYGLSISQVQPQVPGEYLLEGHSLLYELLLLLIHGGIPEGQDIYLHPVALAGWVGLFVTMLNLLPVGQLDGGHIAYALLGERQDKLSSYMLLLLPVMGLFICGYHAIEAHLSGLEGDRFWEQAFVGANWFVWTLLLLLMRRLSGRRHPPVDPGELSPGRKVVAVACHLMFLLIFMPVPVRTVVIE